MIKVRRNLRNEQLDNSHRSINIIRMIKEKAMGGARNTHRKDKFTQSFGLRKAYIENDQWENTAVHWERSNPVRQRKKRREGGKAKGRKTTKSLRYAVMTKGIYFPFHFDTIGSILIHY